jgi:ferredoxin
MAFSRTTSVVAQPQLRIDPARCDGVGICAHLAPHLVTVDSWGFPIIAPVTTSGQRREAEAAEAGCPRRALFLAPPAQ